MSEFTFWEWHTEWCERVASAIAEAIFAAPAMILRALGHLVGVD